MATGGYALQDSPIVTNDGWSVGQTAAHEQVLNVVPIQVVMLGAIEHEPSNVGVGDSDKLVVAEFDEWLAGRDEAAASIRHGAAGLGQYPSKHSSCAQFLKYQVILNFNVESDHFIIVMDTTRIFPRMNAP
ncbi:hypothetical protein V6N13_072054 [Hibiscus sabdariffa]